MKKTTDTSETGLEALIVLSLVGGGTPSFEQIKNRGPGQLLLTALAQLVCDRTGQNHQPFMAKGVSLVTETNLAASPPVLRRLVLGQGKRQEEGLGPVAPHSLGSFCRQRKPAR
jgi:hypothetical protein